jgi:hypothetical protein
MKIKEFWWSFQEWNSQKDLNALYNRDFKALVLQEDVLTAFWMEKLEYETQIGTSYMWKHRLVSY